MDSASTDIFIMAAAIAAVFLLLRFFEARINRKEEPVTLKVMMYDTAVTYVAAVLGLWVFAQLGSVMPTKGPPQVFTTDPGF
jgi:uncharacterized membrane protein YbjE (DUF340 family)